MKQRISDRITGELTLNYLTKRSAAGWRIASIEWERDAEEAAPADSDQPLLAPGSTPFGLRLAPATAILEENPSEAAVLLLILEQIIREKRIPEIARQLNEAGYRTRTGEPWTPTAVFELLPRLIEVGPAVLKSPAWAQRRTAAAQKPN